MPTRPFRWKGKHGFEAVQEIVEKYGFALKAPWNDFVYWQRNFHNITHTHIAVICNACEYSNGRCTVQNLKKTRPGCLCGKLRWSNFVSKKVLDPLVSDSRFEWMDCANNEEWWTKNIVGESSIMPIRCMICNTSCRSTIHAFRCKKSSCSCKRWNITLEDLEELASSKNYTLVSFDKIHSYATILVRCNICQMTLPTTWQSLRQCGISCHCSTMTRWRHVEMRPTFVDMVRATRYHVPDFAKTDQEWTKKRLKYCRIIHLTCKDCGFESSGQLHRFVQYRTLPCKCSRFQTESMFVTMIAKCVEKFVDVSFAPQVFTRYDDGRGFIDAIVYHNNVALVAFELDGEQHFRNVWKDSELFANQIRRDYNKEVHCRKIGLPLVRFYQPDVLRMQLNTEELITEAIELALQSSLPMNLYCSKDRQVYTCVCQGHGMCAWCN